MCRNSSMSSTEPLLLNASGTRTQALRNSLITRQLEWWRRGESEYSGLLKTHNLFIFRNAKNERNGEIALNWNVSGTWTISWLRHFFREAKSWWGRVRPGGMAYGGSMVRG